MTEPTPHELVLDTLEEATRRTNALSPEECIEFVRGFVEMIQQNQSDSSDDPVNVMFTALLAAGMVQECFIKAYTHVEEHVDAVDELNRLFEL